jgi:putative endonuclease
VDTHRVGRFFEGVAARWLAARGWEIVERNVRFRRKEVDLVIRRGDLVAFVEVKGRRGKGSGHPLEAITARKRAEIEFVAAWWWEHHGDPGLGCRFDAVAVSLGPDGVVAVDHLEDAWRPGWR